MGWRGAPPGGGRLILFHGASGTGKTHAVQTLAGAWRDWADLHVVSDPEELLANPGYLMTVGNPRGETRAGRWRLAVLEDVGQHLSADTGASRQTVGRLLNVGDGVLGAALRLIVLLTTNERPEHLDGRLRRPGRLLTEVAFESLTRPEIERWCATRSVAPPNRERSTLAELYALAAGQSRTPPRAALGFAPASG
nr:AAA family ATPase [Conexibacter arvalis]